MIRCLKLLQHRTLGPLILKRGSQHYLKDSLKFVGVEGSSKYITKSPISPDIRVSFQEFFGEPAKNRHNGKPMFSVSPTFQKREKENSGNNPSLETELIKEVRNHVLRQATLLQKERPEVIESLKCRTSFGFFYTLDVDEVLPDSRSTWSLQELNFLINKNENERRSTLVSSFSQFLFGLMQRTNFYKKDFYRKEKMFSGEDQQNHLLKENLLEDPHLALRKFERLYEETLNKSGYSEIPVGENVSTKEQAHFVVSFYPFSLYGKEAKMMLNKDGNLISIVEQPVLWMQTNIIADKPQFQEQKKMHENHDIRISLKTKKEFSPSDEIFKFVFPHGKIDEPLLKLCPNGSFKWHYAVSSEFRTSIYGILHRPNICSFTNGVSKASIDAGVLYVPWKTKRTFPTDQQHPDPGSEAKHMLITDRFCSINLHHSTDKMKEALLTQPYPNLDSFASDVVDQSLALSSHLSKICLNSELEDTNGDILLVGDSNSNHVGTRTLHDNKQVRKLKRSTIKEALKDIPECEHPDKVTDIVFQLGMNDMIEGATAKDIQKQTKKLLENYSKRFENATFHLTALPPSEKSREEANHGLKKLARRTGNNFIALRSVNDHKNIFIDMKRSLHSTDSPTQYNKKRET